MKKCRCYNKKNQWDKLHKSGIKNIIHLWTSCGISTFICKSICLILEEKKVGNIF